MSISVVAKNTKRLIASKGLKNKSVASKAGYSEKQFSALLNNRCIIKDSDIAAIANALEVTPNEIFGIAN